MKIAMMKRFLKLTQYFNEKQKHKYFKIFECKYYVYYETI